MGGQERFASSGVYTYDSEDRGGEVARDLGVIPSLEEMVETALQLAQHPGTVNQQLTPALTAETYQGSPASADCSIAVVRNCTSS